MAICIALMVLSVFNLPLEEKVSAAPAAHDNKAEYSQLCRLARMLRRGYQPPEVGSGQNLKEMVQAIRQKIEDTERWRDKLTNKTVRTLKRIKKRVDTLETTWKQATAGRMGSEINPKLLGALYGTGQSEAGLASFQNNYVTACGGSNAAGANTVGQSIVSDLVCLCATSASSQSTTTDGTVCAAGLRLDKNSDNYSGKSPALAAWTKLAVDCLTDKDDEEKTTPLTPQTLRSQIHRVLNLLGKQAGSGLSSGKGTYVLGKAHTDGKCAGVDTEQLCVNYNFWYAGAGATGHIPWEKTLESAAELMESNRQTYESRRNLHKELEILNESVEEIQEEVNSTIVSAQSISNEKEAGKQAAEAGPSSHSTATATRDFKQEARTYQACATHTLGLIVATSL